MKELQRVKVMERLCVGDLSNQEAAVELGICRRQIIRLKKKYTKQGDRGLIHGNRGRQPRHSLKDETRAAVLSLYQQKYYDFNFSHFTERLNEEKDISIVRVRRKGPLRVHRKGPQTRPPKGPIQNLSMNLYTEPDQWLRERTWNEKRQLRYWSK